jgi:glycosyltransferase involved in cell wall biosynthesis
VPRERASRGRLFVVSHPSVVPVNQAVYVRLRELGWDPLVVVPERWRHDYADGSFRPRPLPGLEGRLRPLPVALPGRPQQHLYLARLRRLLDELRPRAIFIEEECFSVPALQWGTAAARAGVPFGVQAAENRDRAMPRPARWIRSRTLARAAFVAARSPAAADLARRWGATGEVMLVPHAVPRWQPEPRRRDGAFTVGFAGRLVEDKGLRHLLEAVRLLPPPVRLLLVGDGPMRAELEEARLGESEIEIRTGVTHERMPAAYAEMDVLALPSLTNRRGAEQFGRVLVEALSCGVPVVGSDCGEIPWVIETTGGGTVVREGDSRALAAALADLRDQPERRVALAHRGGLVVEETFSVDAAAEALDRALVATVDRERRGRRQGSRGGRPSVALVAHGIHEHGGMERAFFELVRLAHRDYRFVVLAEELAPELRPLVEWRRIRVPRHPIPLKFALFFVVAGLRLRRASVDLVHTMGAVVPNRADVACVQFCHAGFAAVVGRRALEGRPPLRRINTALARALGLAAERWWFGTARVRALAAVSQGVRRELETHYPGVRTELTPNGVDVDRFRPDAGMRVRVRRAAGVGDDEVVALFVGGDWDHKGVAVAIEGLAEARQVGASRLRLWVVGRGDGRRFGAIARGAGVEDAVEFFGPQRETHRFYQAADVFVLPSLYETFSLAAYEAAASGLPVVATRVSGIVDLVGEDGAGILVDRTPGAVGLALVRLASDPALRARLGEEGRRRAQGYSWARSVAAVCDVYRRLLAELRPAAVWR